MVTGSPSFLQVLQPSNAAGKAHGEWVGGGGGGGLINGLTSVC